VQICDRRRIVFALDKARNFGQRPRPVQRVHGHQIGKFVRFELAQIALHASRFKLENAGGVARPEEGEGFIVVVRDVAELDLFVVHTAYNAQRVIQDGQVAES
jgi:hypothetical protein